MFNFIKKGVVDKERDKNDRKEKRKKDKKTKDGGASISSSMSSEELLRLDEVCTLCAIVSSEGHPIFYVFDYVGASFT